MASAADLGKVKMQGSILATLVREQINSGNTAADDSVSTALTRKSLLQHFLYRISLLINIILIFVHFISRYLGCLLLMTLLY